MTSRLASRHGTSGLWSSRSTVERFSSLGLSPLEEAIRQHDHVQMTAPLAGPPLGAAASGDWPGRVRRLPSQVQSEGRHAWMDNLRVAVIAGVVITHVATAYALDIDWYYEERTASAVTEVVLASIILPSALFAMAALFLVAGILSARSLARLGARTFLRRRLVRLGCPTALFVLVLGPLAATIGDRAEGQMSYPNDVWRTFADNVRTTDSGPMWFVIALLTFTSVYALTSVARRGRSNRRDAPLRLWHLVLSAATIVVASFTVRLVWPFTADTPFTLNLWEWPQMAVMFGFGAVAGERRWLDPPPAWLWRVCATGGALGVFTIVATGVALAGSSNQEVFLGGMHLQALAEPVAEACLAVSMALWTALLFKQHITFDGPVARALGRASYCAYVVHPVTVVVLSAALASVAVVAEIKFIVVATLGIAASFTIGWILVTLPHWPPALRWVHVAAYYPRVRPPGPVSFRAREGGRRDR
jgi:Acyltransferase family